MKWIVEIRGILKDNKNVIKSSMFYAVEITESIGTTVFLQLICKDYIPHQWNMIVDILERKGAKWRRAPEVIEYEDFEISRKGVIYTLRCNIPNEE